MSQYGNAATAKNPPWVHRSGQNISMGVGQTGQMPPPLMANAIQPIANASVLQYPQQQVFQGQMGIQQTPMNMGGMAGIPTASVAPMQASLGTSQMYGAVGAVSYPTRALNSAAFQSSSSSSTSSSSSQPQNTSNSKQRVFTGTVTKIQDNFGFVDEDIFFQTSCCVKGSSPQVGDRVLVEAVYNANMPFKWNATRIQVLPVARENTIGNLPNIATMQTQRNFGSSGYNAVPPPNENSIGGNRFTGGSRFSSGGGDRRDRNRDRPRPQRDDSGEQDRKRRRDDRDKDRDDKDKDRMKSPPPRKRSKSPPRSVRRARRVVPRYSVQIPKILLDSTQGDVLELRRRYTNMYIPSDFFSAGFSWVDTFPLSKPVSLNFPCSFHVMHKEVDPVITNNAVLEPPDLDYLYSAKVMLLSSPGLEEIYSKCISLAEDKDREGSRSTDDEQYLHPARLVQFLVGLRGKNETMAIGGPWSASLDGENPQNDPGVLIKTATRNCLALTGIDLSACTQWFRFLEIHYHRAETVHKGKCVPARVETVVLFIPDVWSCLPTRLEWDGLQLNYQKQLAQKLNKDTTADEKDEDQDVIVPKREPKHHSELDPKTMKVNELREELEARSLSPKGLKSQLVARLAKVIKTEADEEAAKKDTSPKIDKKDEEEKKRKEEDDKKKSDDRDKVVVEKRYKLPESPHIIVHPHRTAKSGKFDCTIMSLSSLLGYRQDDAKEHSFEVSLFAELFNEMLMRDFGFNIYRAVFEVPEKLKDDKDDKDRRKEKSKDDKEKDSKDKKDDDMDEDDDGTEDDDDKDKRDSKKDDERKKNTEKAKLYTIDPLLLLSFCYFDTTRCGYIFDKDLEDLFFCLGLSLSRAQVKKMVQKVVTRDSLHYRKLTDKTKEDSDADVKIVESITTLALGNKRLLMNSSDEDSATAKKGKGVAELSSGFVSFNGSLVDVGKLLEQLNKSEESRVDAEKTLGKFRQDYVKLKDNLQKVERNNKDLVLDLKDFKERLTNANSELCVMDSKARCYLSTLSDIYEKVKPIVAVPEVKEVEIVEVKKDNGTPERDTRRKRRDSWGEKKQTSGDKETRKTETESKPGVDESSDKKGESEAQKAEKEQEESKENETSMEIDEK